MRRWFKIAAVGTVVSSVAFAGLALFALRNELPHKPQLPGKAETGRLEHGGRTRTWIAYVPAKPQANPALVIALHGSMGTGERARRVYGYDFDLLAEKHGFIAVYPQGYGGYWNDCKVKGSYAAKSENADDVGFLHALVDRLVKDYTCDRAHVYVTGVSNGGSMAIRLALANAGFRARLCRRRLQRTHTGEPADQTKGRAGVDAAHERHRRPL